MIEEVIHSYALTLGLIRRALGELGAEALVSQPAGAPNHPLWTLGHLIHSAQAIGGELGLEPWLPATWAATFGTGSTPVADAKLYPPRAELLKRLEHAEGQLAQRLRVLPQSVLLGPLPDERHRSSFPSLAHAVVHILTAHTSFHAGQVMLWRRAQALPTEPAL